MGRWILERSGPNGLIFSGAAVIFAVLGQFLLTNRSTPAAVSAFAVALTCLGISLRFSSPRPEMGDLAASHVSDAGKRSRVIPGRFRILLTILALLLGALCFLASGGNRFTLLNVGLWVSSVLILVVALGDRPSRPRVSLGVLVGVVFLLLLGAVFYYYRLDAVPAEMTSDHAEKLTDIYDLLNGQAPIFFIRNTGREPLEFYLVAAFIRLVHHSLDFMALKWVTATVGLLVVPITFLLGRTLFDGWAGLVGAALAAVNMWSLGIARMGLRFPFTPLFAALTFLFLFRALKFGRRNDFLLTGFFLGAGLYGYHAFKIAPLVAAACFLLWPVFAAWAGRGLADRQAVRRYISNLFAAAMVTLLVFVPLLRYMMDHPESFWQRVLTRVSSEERALPGEPVLIFADNLKNLALMFNVEGDRSWPNGLSDVPVLDEVSGGLFALGVAYALYRFLRKKEITYALMLLCLAGMLLPSALAIAFPIENPSVVRAGGAIPFAFLLAALPLAGFARELAKGRGRLRPAVAGAAVVSLILVSAALNYDRYFVRFDAQYRANSWNSSEIAGTMLSFARSGGSLSEAWVVAYPYWVDTRNVAINLGDIRWDNVIWKTGEIKDALEDKGPRLYILSTSDRVNLDGLDLLFPSGEARVITSRTPGKEYVAFYVPGRTTGKSTAP